MAVSLPIGKLSILSRNITKVYLYAIIGGILLGRNSFEIIITKWCIKTFAYLELRVYIYYHLTVDIFYLK